MTEVFKDYGTRNNSFLEVGVELMKNDVANNDFFLSLLDVNLLGG